MAEEAAVISAPVAAPVVADIAPVAPEAPAEGEQPSPETPADPAPAKTEPAPGEGKNRFQRKLDKVYRERAEAQGRADFLERQLNELRAAQAPQASPGAPKLEDFSDIQEYAKAYAEHEKQRAFQEIGTRNQQASVAKARADLIANWESKTDNDKYPDFHIVVGDLQPNSPWAAAIMEADNGDDIAYYLGKNVEEAKKIIAMGPLAQVRAIGKLEAKLAAEPVKPKPTSQAPAPIAALSGTGSGSGGRPDPKNYDAWLKARNKELGR